MNFSYTTNPGYVDLVGDMYKAIRWHYRAENWGNYTFPQGFFDDMNKYYSFPISEGVPILYIGIAFTFLRYFFEICICNPFVNWMQIDNKSDRSKFPESAWKFLIYGIQWTYIANLLVFSAEFDYFIHPQEIWEDWSIGMPVPDEIKWIYFVECGFYVHSVYGTLYMDEKRKDFLVMLVHHFLTLILIVFSYGTRYHKIGIMVLFVHDAADILLEFTKCNVYLKNRGGKYYAMHDHIANIGFVAFTVAWYLFRLYWFPLKILYTTGVVAAHRAYLRGAGLYCFFNSLLWFLLCLDIYWFYFILLFLYKVATGQLSEIKDTRESEKEENEKKKQN